MKPPIFICNGIFRSGSTWSFNVCRKLGMELARMTAQPFASTFMDHFSLDDFFAKTAGSVVGPTVIKAHFAGPLAMQWLRLSKVRAVCTYRDPRDCVASDRSFLGWDLDKCVNRVRSNYQAIDTYRGCSSILMVRYEEVMRDALGQIHRIASHFGIELSDVAARKIDSETNLQTSMKVCEALKSRSPNDVLHVADHRVDPDTQLHHNHIGNAKIGRWRTDITPEEGRELTRIFHPWLAKFGYDIEAPRPSYTRETAVQMTEMVSNAPVGASSAAGVTASVSS